MNNVKIPQIGLIDALKIIFATLVMMLIFCTVTKADTVISGTCGKSDNISYVLDSDGILTLSGEGDMDIYEGSSDLLPWSSYRTLIKSVIIKSGITSIDHYVFLNCTNLKNVIIPNGVTFIGYYAFDNCTSLESITIPSSVTYIYDYAFNNCTNLSSVKIYGKKTLIYSDTFNNCTGLTTIYCYSDSYAAKYENIEIIYFTEIDEDSIECSGYCGEAASYVLYHDEVTDERNLIIYGVGDMYDYYDWYEEIFSYVEGLEYESTYTEEDSPAWMQYEINNVVIEDGITSIGTGAFSSFSIENVTIPDSVTSIGNSAFYYCTMLENITIPNSVTSIGNLAFGECPITSITIPENVSSLGSLAFYNCANLNSVQLLGSSNIDAYTFYNCTNLESVDISSEISSIGKYAFFGCENFTDIAIPDSVTTIGEWAFAYCTNLASITIPSNVVNVEDSSFLECTSLENITIPSNVVNIEAQAFYSCTSLTSITIPGNVKYIGECAFANCTGLKTLIISDGVETLAQQSFNRCENLENITIPESITTMAAAFSAYCSSIKKVYCVLGSHADRTGFYSSSSTVNFVYVDNKAVKNASTGTVYFITGINVDEGVDITEKYSRCDLYHNDEVIGKTDTVYTGFIIDGVEFDASELGYDYIIGFEITADGEELSDDNISDTISSLTANYTLVPVEADNSEAV